MSRWKTGLVGGLALGCCIALPAIGMLRLATASAAKVECESRLTEVKRLASEVRELRSARQTVAERKRPEQDVIARVTECLHECGVPVERFGGLRPESDTAVGAVAGLPPSGPALRRQSVQITLNELTVGELQAILAQWTARQPLWTPTRLEIVHARDASAGGRYTLNLQLAATYVADGGP